MPDPLAMDTPESGNGLGRFLPIASWLPRYPRTWLRSDLIAGLTVWALVVPQAIAYAQIAGLPAEAGVFASFAAPLGYALFGTSRQLICSPTSATAAISLALVAPVVADNPEDLAAMSAALAILCGIVFMLLGRLKMGFVSQFIATAVQTGFLFGLGLTIIAGQLFKLTGVSSEDGTFYKQFWHFLKSLDEVNDWTLALGGGALAAIVILQRISPRLPAALLVVTVATVCVAVFDLADHGVEVVGDVERAFPTPALPIVPVADLLSLVPGTLAIVVVGYSESISVAQRFADEHKYRIRNNQELVALGASSAIGGLFQGFITAGGASQSAANDRAGARSQVASIVLALLAGLTAVLLMPLFKDLPLAALGAIVISAVSSFLNVAELKRIRQMRRDSFVLAIVALFSVLVLGILPGLLIAVALSILLLLGRISRPTTTELGMVPGTSASVSVERNPEAVRVPGLLILRPDFALLFANAAWVRDRVRANVEATEPKPKVVVLSLEATPELDITTADMLFSLREELGEVGIELWLAPIHAGPRATLETAGGTDLANVSFLSMVEAADVFEERFASE